MFSAVVQVQRVLPEGLDNYNKVVHLYHCDVMSVTWAPSQYSLSWDIHRRPRSTPTSLYMRYMKGRQVLPKGTACGLQKEARESITLVQDTPYQS